MEQLQGIFCSSAAVKVCASVDASAAVWRRVAVLSPTFVAELLFMAASLLLLHRPSIILKLFFGHSGVLGGVLGEVLWRLVSSPAFAKWWGISSPLMGSGSGSLVSMPARADFFAGLLALAVGADNRGSFPSPVPTGSGRWAFIVLHAPWWVRGAESCGTSKDRCLLTVREEDLLPAATASSVDDGQSGRKKMWCLKGFVVFSYFSEDLSVNGVCTVL